jgi:heat shock protein HslJ
MESGMTAAAASRLFLPILALLASSCALPPPPSPLADLGGTDWHVALVNGRQTPTTGDYSLHFGRDGRFGARFGCNSMGGTYQIVGGTLIVSNLAQTLMGCPDPAASFESQGAAVLGQPMQIAFTSNERLSLSNAAGSIAADPVT